MLFIPDLKLIFKRHFKKKFYVLQIATNLWKYFITMIKNYVRFLLISNKLIITLTKTDCTLVLVHFGISNKFVNLIRSYNKNIL